MTRAASLALIAAAAGLALPAAEASAGPGNDWSAIVVNVNPDAQLDPLPTPDTMQAARLPRAAVPPLNARHSLPAARRVPTNVPLVAEAARPAPAPAPAATPTPKIEHETKPEGAAPAAAAKGSAAQPAGHGGDGKGGSGAEGGAAAKGGAAAPAGKAKPPLPADASAAQQYCFNISDAAADARLAWQKKSAAEIDAEVEKRVALLEAKANEVKQWLAKREEFAKKAQDGLVKIYARMKPDAAAAQLALVDEETAAAVVTKLDPRVSSLILNEMDPKQAARLSATMAGVANKKLEPPPAPPAPQGGAPSTPIEAGDPQ